MIVPTLNEAQILTSHFDRQKHLLVDDDVELLLVDGGSEDQTCEKVLSWTARIFRSRAGRAYQMNFAAQHARGEYLIFLHADTIIPAVAWQELRTLLSEGKILWGFCPLRLDGRHRLLRIVERAICLRSRVTGIGTGDQVIFIHKALFDRLGGYTDQALMEDVDLCKRLKVIARPVILSHPVLTSSRRWEQEGIVATVLKMWFIRLAYYCGISPERLARWY